MFSSGDAMKAKLNKEQEVILLSEVIQGKMGIVDFTCKWNLKKVIVELIYKTEIDSQT